MDKIIISACLTGKNIKYNGGNNRIDKPAITRWQNEGRLVPVCPESLGGLPVPRPPAEISGAEVININGDDVTENFEKGARAALDIAEKSGAKYALLKQSSPSCGSEFIYDGTFSHTKIKGMGVAAALLAEHGIKVFDESRIDELDAEIRSKMLPEKIKKTLKRLCDSGYEAYAAGGCVRDMLMGRQPDDYDITTSAAPDEVMNTFADLTVVPTGIKHGTVTVVDGGEHIEITTYRIDGEYADNRHPTEVSFTRNLHEDLARRDFCMNAIAMDFCGKIVDPYGGEADIAARTISCVGEAQKRFHEDGLRILRCIRFASVLGFEIDKTTAEAVHGCVRLLGGISAERIFAELKKLICGTAASKILKEYKDVIFEILPELDTDEYDTAADKINSAPQCADIRLALLAASAAPQCAELICRRLKTDGAMRSVVTKLAANRDLTISPDRISVRRAAARFGADFLPRLADFLRIHSGNETMLEVRRIAEEIKSDGDCCAIADLNISGADITALGAEGRQIGQVLAQLLDAVMCEKTKNTKEDLLEYIKREKLI